MICKNWMKFDCEKRRKCHGIFDDFFNQTCCNSTFSAFQRTPTTRTTLSMTKCALDPQTLLHFVYFSTFNLILMCTWSKMLSSDLKNIILAALKWQQSQRLNTFFMSLAFFFSNFSLSSFFQFNMRNQKCKMHKNIERKL